MLIGLERVDLLESSGLMDSLLDGALSFRNEVHFISFTPVINDQIFRLCELSL